MTPQTTQPSLGLVFHPSLQCNWCWDGHILTAAAPKARERAWTVGKDFLNTQHIQSCATAPTGKHSPAKTTSAPGTAEELPLTNTQQGWAPCTHHSCSGPGLAELQGAAAPMPQLRLSAHLSHLSHLCRARDSQETPAWDSWGNLQWHMAQTQWGKGAESLGATLGTKKYSKELITGEGDFSLIF